ncbi:aspartate/glutamate racemase family protein [Sulfitobacter aestuarii]|uniref:Aspartate/glutamate racemase family protein n=1 Tax=Sulfitobacter aestuarii TaxID=2161676 RepID=A0ABW5U5D5_9RHOB
MSGRVVGILGGMGPAATILLQQRLLDRVQAVDDVDHLPLLIDMNPQVPSRIAHLVEGQGESPGPVLADMARRLEQIGATALAMPCNTAHHHALEIEAAVQIPLLNMVRLSVAEAALSLPRGARLGLLASPAVRQAGVFAPALDEAGIGALWPADQSAMLVAIRDIKRCGDTTTARRIFKDAAAELIGRGADLLLIACSEFSLIAHVLPGNTPTIDTIDVLAKAIHDHTLKD